MDRAAGAYNLEENVVFFCIIDMTIGSIIRSRYLHREGMETLQIDTLGGLRILS